MDIFPPPFLLPILFMMGKDGEYEPGGYLLGSVIRNRGDDQIGNHDLCPTCIYIWIKLHRLCMNRGLEHRDIELLRNMKG
jgi:hypothetical protein